MRYLSVCSGIEAASVAWHPLGFQPVAFSEIEAFPSAVLKHHYPTVPNWGDMTRFKDWPDATVDVLVGGTPCQSFSVAGLRAGLDDPRGNLALTYLAVADRYRPEWVVWENVPGVLSSNSGRDFGAFLGGLGQLGYRWCYRSLDAQYFGLAQRRKRVFVVGHLGDWRRAAAVLLERESLSGHLAPRREAGEGTTYRSAPSLTASGRGTERAGDSRGQDCVVPVLMPSTGDISHCLNAGAMGRIDYESETLIAHSLRADGFDASEDGTGRGTPLIATPINLQVATRHEALGESTGFGVGEPGDPAYTLSKSHTHAIAFSAKDYGADAGDLAPTLRAGGHADSHANGGVMAAVAFQEAQTGVREYALAGALRANGPGHDPVGTRIREGMQVRRLTPRECERLQGFPDDSKSITIRVCRNEGERQELARSVGQSSQAQKPGSSRPVAVDVLIDLERQHLQLRSLGKSNWSASFADGQNSSPLPTPLADFAHLVAVTASTLVRETPIGAAESLLITKDFSAPWSGSVSVHLCGREIEERVADAGWCIPALSHSMKSITLEAGPNSQNSGARWRTLCCSVAAAISSFIPDGIRESSSYDLRLTTISGYTLVSYRGKPAKDGPRYKALGNSMAVPVMRWIGQRIALIESITRELERTA